MKTTTREVYHCEHCSKYMLRKSAMVDHERYCLKNPAHACKVCGGRFESVSPLESESPREYLVRLWGLEDCPLCILSHFIHNGVSTIDAGWDYEAAYKTYREEQFENWRPGYVSV